MSEIRGNDRTRIGAGATRRGALSFLAALGFGGSVARGEIDAAKATMHPRTKHPHDLLQEQDQMAEPTITHLNPEGMHANPAYSQGVAVSGAVKTIYVGGQNAVDAEGQIVGKGDLAAQTEQAIANLETVLAAAGASLHDVVKWTVFVVQGHDFMPGFAVYQQKWGTAAPPPAVTANIVAGLANPDFLVEIEAIAVVGDG